MKKIIAISAFFFCLACQSNDILPDDGTMISTFDNQTLISEGSFMAAAHPASGKAKIYKDKDGKLTLSLENFMTDAGPDLRIYLAEDKATTNFIEVSKSVKNGTTSYTIPTTADLSKQKNALIWCKQFAVLFGSAELK
jgi:Electron transfer DM13